MIIPFSLLSNKEESIQLIFVIFDIILEYQCKIRISRIYIQHGDVSAHKLVHDYRMYIFQYMTSRKGNLVYVIIWLTLEFVICLLMLNRRSYWPPGDPYLARNNNFELDSKTRSLYMSLSEKGQYANVALLHI